MFARDIRDWHRLTDRLYIWDYTTDFSHYLLPFPNYYVLGPNVRLFHQNGVVGLFEQGAYQSFSGEMSEMRAWVLAQLLWNPYQDDRKLVRELSGLAFVERAHNVVLLGPPGVGKTHLAVALGVKAVEAGYTVLFLTLEKLMTRLGRARPESRLDRTLPQVSLIKISRPPRTYSQLAIPPLLSKKKKRTDTSAPPLHYNSA